MSRGTTAGAASKPIELRISRRWIVLGGLLFLGLLVRFWAMRWPPFPFDMNTWIAWSERLRAVGPGDFYQEGYFADYTPGYLYVLWLIAEVKHALFESAGTGTYHVLQRLPATLCDLVIAVVIFRFVQQRLDRTGDGAGAATVTDDWPVLPAAVTALWLFNPAVIFNSAVWGQVDSTFTLGMLLTLVFLINGRPEAAIVSYAVAFLLKPHAITIAPVVGLALILWFPPARVARAIGLGALVGVVLLLPFFGLRFIPGLWGLLADSREQYAYTSLYSYNLWGIYGFWRDDMVSVFGPFTARGIGLGLFVLGLAYGVGLLWAELRRGADRAFTVFLFATYFAWMPVMVLTTMHERYVYPVLPFLLVFAALCYIRWSAAVEAGDSGPRFLLVPLFLCVAVTVLHTMNIYQVYEFYLYFDRGGVPTTNRLFYRIADNARVWSVLFLLCFWAFAVFMPSWLAGARREGAEAVEGGPEVRPPLRSEPV
jgi:dolichyl-phosphate-mannose-protein mannosyltransferase